MSKSGSRRRFLGVALSCLMVVAACSSEDDDDGGSSASPETPEEGSSSTRDETGLAEATDEIPVVEDYDLSFALDYVDGSDGAADSSVDPVTIGWISEEVGATGFPEAVAAARAAVDFVNERLGGIDGAPLRLETCATTSAEETQQCTTRLVNDSAINLIIQGPMIGAGGQEAIYQAAAQSDKAVIVALPTAPVENTADGPFAFLAGGTASFLAGVDLILSDDLASVEKVAVVHLDTPSGVAGARILDEPLTSAGLDVQLVAVPGSGTGPDYAAALQAAGGADADVVFAATSPPGCIAIQNALELLGAAPVFVGLSSCLTDPVRDAMGRIPDGYYVLTSSNYYIPDDVSGTRTFLGALRQYGDADVRYDGFAPAGFAAVLNATMFLNSVGPEEMSEGTFRAAAMDFAGPAFMTPGPMACGRVSGFASLCGRAANVFKFSDGTWESTRSILTDNPAIVLDET